MFFDRRFDRIERDGAEDENRHDQNVECRMSNVEASNCLAMRAYSAMLGALSKPETSATRHAPAAMTCSRLSIFIPPMQKIGSLTATCTRLISFRPIG